MLMDVLDSTKFQGTLVMEQKSYGCFGQDQIPANKKMYICNDILT